MAKIDVSLETVDRALAGSRADLDELVRRLQGPFYDLARRLLLDRGDAEDAAQEALLRVVTHLAQFDRRARFSTWAWRIALNASLDARDRRYRAPVLAEADVGADLAAGLDLEAPERPEDAALLGELKVGCGIAMLSTLDGDHRAAYVLGDILELDGAEAAVVLELEPATYRKRLSRARERVAGALQRWCGIVREENPCRCHRRLARARELGRVSGAPTSPAVDLPALRAQVQRMESLRAATAYYRADGSLRPGPELARRVREALRLQAEDPEPAGSARPAGGDA